MRRFASAPSSLRSGSLGNRDKCIVEEREKKKEHTRARLRARINSSITDGGFFCRSTHFDIFATTRSCRGGRGSSSGSSSNVSFRGCAFAHIPLKGNSFPLLSFGEIKRTFRNRRCTWGVDPGHSLNRERYVHRANVNGRYSLTSSYSPIVSTG